MSVAGQIMVIGGDHRYIFQLNLAHKQVNFTIIRWNFFETFLKYYISENLNVEIWDPTTESWIISEAGENGFPMNYRGFTVWFRDINFNDILLLTSVKLHESQTILSDGITL